MTASNFFSVIEENNILDMDWTSVEQTPPPRPNSALIFSHSLDLGFCMELHQITHEYQSHKQWMKLFNEKKTPCLRMLKKKQYKKTDLVQFWTKM